MLKRILVHSMPKHVHPYIRAIVIILILGLVALLLYIRASTPAIDEPTVQGTSSGEIEPIADTNGDFRVTIADLSYLLSRWNSNDTTADFTNDNVVNILDLSYFMRQWGRDETASRGLATGSFFIHGRQIIDPAGDVFYPVGVNVNGPEAWDGNKTQLQTIGRSDDALAWGFNTIRLTSCYAQGDRNYGSYPDDDVHAIIQEYTAKKIVVMLEGRYDCDHAGSPPQQWQYDTIESEFVDLAHRYADNPYVWFNLFNEPTHYTNDPSHDIWKRIHSDMTRAIRATGNTNIIVVDGSNFGQENHHSNGYTTVDQTDSAILKYGPDVQAIGTCNMLFSFHVYTEWKAGSDSMRNYIQTVHDNDMALIIGEVGRTDNAATIAGFGAEPEHHYVSVASAYEIGPEQGVGVLAWHGAGSDSFDLVYEPGAPVGYWTKNASGSNLTPFGNLHWNLSQNAPSFAVDPGTVVPDCL